jgi:hypothetical protein
MSTKFCIYSTNTGPGVHDWVFTFPPSLLALCNLKIIKSFTVYSYVITRVITRY